MNSELNSIIAEIHSEFLAKEKPNKKVVLISIVDNNGGPGLSTKLPFKVVLFHQDKIQGFNVQVIRLDYNPEEENFLDLVNDLVCYNIYALYELICYNIYALYELIKYKSSQADIPTLINEILQLIYLTFEGFFKEFINKYPETWKYFQKFIDEYYGIPYNHYDFDREVDLFELPKDSSIIHFG